jgi:mRNA interferase HicA
VIKPLDLGRHLRAHGCELLREGGRHAIWWNPENQKRASVPRHRQLPATTAKAICVQLGINTI